MARSPPTRALAAVLALAILTARQLNPEVTIVAAATERAASSVAGPPSPGSADTPNIIERTITLSTSAAGTIDANVGGTTKTLPDSFTGLINHRDYRVRFDLMQLLQSANN